MDKSRDKTLATNILNENKLAIKSRDAGTSGVHGVNTIHSRDGVLRVNSIMKGMIKVKIDEVKRFDKLDPR